MFSYYGTKNRLGRFYPIPQYDTIIEPFAGAAAYSCQYPERQVILYDAYDKVAETWRYLIKAAKEEILSLPELGIGDKVTDYNLCSGAKNLIGFCINPGSSCPKITASKRAKWPIYKAKIAEFVPKIKHWKVFQESYVYADNRKATWFVDPPYQKAGKYYFGYNQINFKTLGNWCREREGQVIVCENAGADWLPFQFLTEHRGSIQNNTEVVYYQNSEEFF